MTVKELAKILKDNGIVGAGGAGFPTYAKLSEKADTIILNCAECEPLLKLHRQVLKFNTVEIFDTLCLIAETLGAKDIVIAIKEAYKTTLQAVKATLPAYKNIRLSLLPEVYPAGDEVMIVYETTKRIVPPGKIPIEVGAIVFNVETVFNIYKAIEKEEPVTYKYITLAGEIEKPITVKAPLGITFDEVLKKAEGITVEDFGLICGGPMTGTVAQLSDVVTKTTNAILVFPKDHYIINKKLANNKHNMKRAMSACCQCRMCTDLCSRNLLGHPIKPHEFMRAATSGDTRKLEPFLNTFYCSGCGLCEMYACQQGLSPRTLILEYKAGLRKNGIKPPENVQNEGINPLRALRQVPKARVKSRLGLSEYNRAAPIDEEIIKTDKVKILLSQHVGAPAKPIVKKGDVVKAGQLIAEANEGLSVNIHASIDGTVTKVSDGFIIISAN